MSRGRLEQQCEREVIIVEEFLETGRQQQICERLLGLSPDGVLRLCDVQKLFPAITHESVEAIFLAIHEKGPTRFDVQYVVCGEVIKNGYNKHVIMIASSRDTVSRMIKERDVSNATANIYRILDRSMRMGSSGRQYNMNLLASKRLRVAPIPLAPKRPVVMRKYPLASREKLMALEKRTPIQNSLASFNDETLAASTRSHRPGKFTNSDAGVSEPPYKITKREQ